MTEGLIQKAVSIITRYLPNSKVYLFGSYVLGTFSSTSDIDIALLDNKKIDLVVLNNIKSELDQIKTLRSFDIIDLQRVSKDFKDAILSYAQLIYSPNEQ